MKLEFNSIDEVLNFVACLDPDLLKDDKKPNPPNNPPESKQPEETFFNINLPKKD